MSIEKYTNKIIYPYYELKFEKIPYNYFSLGLIGFKGYYSDELYEETLSKFKYDLKQTDPKFEKLTNYDNFVNIDDSIPKDSYLYSLSNIIYPNIDDDFYYSKNNYNYIIRELTEKKPIREKANTLLKGICYYFNISYSLYSDDISIFSNEPYKDVYLKDSKHKVTYYTPSINKILPILKRYQNGDLKINYSFLT